VTFIHEGGHNRRVVDRQFGCSLSVATNAGGETYHSGWIDIAGSCLECGVCWVDGLWTLLLTLIKSVAARIVLLGSGVLFALTMIYGLFKPLFSGFARWEYRLRW
jgi:hypothetical protein